jgi:hypothetical protein
MSIKTNIFSYKFIILTILSSSFLTINASPIPKTQNSSLRKLWNEKVEYDSSRLTDEELDSLNHCINSDYKYFIFYTSGQTYEFKEFINEGNAVSK